MGHKNRILCRFFLRGNCTKGRICKFEHNLLDGQAKFERQHQSSYSYNQNYNQQQQPQNWNNNLFNQQQQQQHSNNHNYHYQQQPFYNNNQNMGKIKQHCKYRENCFKFPNCGFVHEEVCRFQDHCLRKDQCRFVHLPRAFLGRNSPPPSKEAVVKNQFLEHSNLNNVNIVHTNYLGYKNVKQKNRRPKACYKKNSNKPFSILSCNASNIKSKLYSLGKVVNDLNVSIFCIQETFMSKEGNIKFENSTEYQIFECIRNFKQGGGLAIGALKTLNPIWIKEGNNLVEALTIQVSVQKLNLRITNAYGPQEYDDIAKKIVFGHF